MDTAAGAQSISQVWHEVLGEQHAPDTWLVVATGLAACVLVFAPRAWQLSRNVVTIAHEGGHGLIAVLTGRRLSGIRLHSDTSGLTVSKGKPTGLGMILTASAGYLAPPLLGLGGAWLLSANRITALLWGVLVLLACMLLMIRNAYGVLTVVVTGAVFLGVSWFASTAIQGAFAYLSVWFLLLSGARPVFELQAKRHRGQAPDSDADQLHRLTSLPGIAWVLLFAAVAVLSFVGAARWMLALD